MYLVILSTDGDVEIEGYDSEQKMIEAINEDTERYDDFGFMDKLPGETDPQQWPEKHLCLKADIVIPKPKESVTEYGL